jgi:hypothetical protein
VRWALVVVVKWLIRGAVIATVANDATTAHAQTERPSTPAAQAAAETDDRQTDPDAVEGLQEVDDETAEAPTGPGPAAPTKGVMVTGYIDVGFAKAQGNGTSYPPGDLRVPADYGVDTFATAVNSRGDVASDDPNGRFVNGFSPRSMGIGGHGSMLFNALSADLRYTSRGAPLFVFARAVMLPRLSAAGDSTRVMLEQGFGRLTPLDSAELAISIGKFDSVFGIEYLENPSNIRIGITPSLMARYTTGTSLGAKIFYRIQIPIIWSALSVNLAGTNSGNFIEALQGPDANLTGVPVASGRVGYELNLPWVEIKLGASGLQGPRNDQRDPESRQRMWGFDARLYVAGLALNGEYVHVDEDSGSVPKLTGDGLFPLTTEFHARGFYAQATYGFPITRRVFRRLYVYARVEQRHAWFEGFRPVTVQRGTGGLRLDLWDEVALKGEMLVNREVEGAPQVANNVLTSSLVYTW